MSFEVDSEGEEKQLTVAGLIELLKTMPQHLLVQTEGCDCYGPCVGVKERFSSYAETTSVVLRRGGTSETE